MNIKELRESLNLSTSELALRLGISQSSVVRLEQSAARGTISINTLEKAVKALGGELKVTLTVARKAKSKKAYRGLKRTHLPITKNTSRLAKAMKADEDNLTRAMSESERISRCFELSDFTKGLK